MQTAPPTPGLGSDHFLGLTLGVEAVGRAWVPSVMSSGMKATAPSSKLVMVKSTHPVLAGEKGREEKGPVSLLTFPPYHPLFLSVFSCVGLPFPIPRSLWMTPSGTWGKTSLTL